MIYLAFLLFPFMVNKDTKPYVRSTPNDGPFPLRCSDDIHCPLGSKCYIPKNYNGNSINPGVCVVTYDKKLLNNPNVEIW